MKILLFALLLSLLASLAQAHPDHGLQSAFSGLMHPFTGWDHLLVMLAIGLWAAKIGGKMRWQLPLTFVAFMLLGALFGLLGVGYNGVETAIATSLVGFGFLVVFNLPINQMTRFGLVALFATFHGLAHGVELKVSVSMLAMAGMLFSTAVLHALGLAIGTQRFQFAKWFSACVAWFMIFFGSFLLIS